MEISISQTINRFTNITDSKKTMGCCREARTVENRDEKCSLGVAGWKFGMETVQGV